MRQMKAKISHLGNTFRIGIILSALCLSGSAFALNNNDLGFAADSVLVASSPNQNYRDQDNSAFKSVVQPFRYLHAQSNRNGSSLRSKSEVMQEVKSRYNGKVVKISLNERTATYNVRVLLPSGKVKNLSVNARR